MYLESEVVLCCFFFFLQGLSGMGFMFHGNHMFHRSLTLPARRSDTSRQQELNLTMRKQQVALGVLPSGVGGRPGTRSVTLEGAWK